MEGTPPLLLKIRVYPSSKASLARQSGPASFDVFVRAQPRRGLANRECISVLAEHLGCPPSELKLLRGQHSSRKIIEWRKKC